MNRLARSLPLLALLLPAGPLAAAPAEGGEVESLSPAERGDAAFAHRADGFLDSGTPNAAAVREAIEAYEEALAERPDDVGLRLRLAEALYFEDHFVLDARKERKKAFDRLAQQCEKTVELAEAGKDGAVTADQLAEAHFWAAISWGLWGMSHSKAASGFKDVAGRIRDHADVLRSLDESHRDAGALRLLGRLHAATPRVPLFTGWIDPSKGVELLSRACEISKADARNPLFLAEALLDHAPERREEALALLREVAARTPDPSYLVEQTEILDQARARLEAETGRPVRAAR